MSLQEETQLELQLEVADLVVVAHLALRLALARDRLCLPQVVLHHEEGPSKPHLLFRHAYCHQHHHLHLLFPHEV